MKTIVKEANNLKPHVVFTVRNSGSLFCHVQHYERWYRRL